jgi:outer membrane lipoprotein-sorting protein
MKADNNNQLDELISQNIGREKPKFDFDKWKKAHQSEIQIYESQTIDDKALRYAEPSNIWRIIMNSKKIKLGTVAVVTLAVVVGVTLIDRSAIPAYAIEQTIEAMRSISSIHAYSTEGDGSEAEIWIQIDPETGWEECYSVDEGNLLTVANPEKTYYYEKDKNLVRISNKYITAVEVRFSRFFEDLADWVQNHNGKFDYQFEFDQDLQKEVIRVRVHIPAQGNFGGEESIFNVDPETKLPINFELNNQKGKTVVQLEYNIPIPQGLFDFEIPEGAEVVYE